MIEWGMHGLGGASAGLILAYHHDMLGPYFGDIAGNEWPHTPLHKPPKSLENDFHQLLANITFAMSNGTLENISLLDLPGFGSIIKTLKQGLKKQFIWPIKTSFTILKNNPATEMSNLLLSYKSLFEDWSGYMDHLDKNDYAKFYTPEMRNNTQLDFTHFIKSDMKTFLTLIAGDATTQCPQRSFDPPNF
jgi:hypothetical protein